MFAQIHLSVVDQRVAVMVPEASGLPVSAVDFLKTLEEGISREGVNRFVYDRRGLGQFARSTVSDLRKGAPAFYGRIAGMAIISDSLSVRFAISAIDLFVPFPLKLFPTMETAVEWVKALPDAKKPSVRVRAS